MENEKQEREYLTNLLRQNKSDTGKQDLVSLRDFHCKPPLRHSVYFWEWLRYR